MIRCLFLPLLCLSAIHASELLDPLIVTASRSGESASESSHSTAIIDAITLRENARRTLPEALQFTPGVLVQKTAHGHGSPFIRGFTGRQNLLLVDGVRINNSTWRSGPIQYWSTVDPYSIDRIELVRSQGSVLYGSDAAGGTLNALTGETAFRAKPATETYHTGSASYGYRSSGQGSHIGRIESNTGIGGVFGARIGFTTKDFGDIEDSSVGRMRGTGYPEEDLDLRFDWAVDSDSTITLVHQYVNQDRISRWHRTTNNPGWNHDGHITTPGKWSVNDYDQERSLTYLRYSNENLAADAVIRRWSATISRQNTRDSEFQNRNPDKDDLRSADINLDTMGYDLQFESDLGPGTLVYGIDHYHDETETRGWKSNLAGTKSSESLPLADDSEYLLTGLFSQYRWDATEALEITGGLRYSMAEAKLGRFYDSSGNLQPSQTQDWESMVGSLRAIGRIDANWSLFGGLAQAFRAPNLNDLTGAVSSKSGGTSFGSANAEPERFLTMETGIRHQSDEFTMEASVFHTQVDDLITSIPISKGSSETVTANAAEGYVYGAECEAAWRFAPQWTLSGFAAWQDGREESPQYDGGPIQDKFMTRLSPLSGSIALRWTHDSDRFWIEGRLLGATEEHRISPTDQKADDQRIPTNGTPGYLIASLRGGWTVNEHLELTLGLENLADDDYRIHGSGQNETGFQAVAGAKVSW